MCSFFNALKVCNFFIFQYFGIKTAKNILTICPNVDALCLVAVRIGTKTQKKVREENLGVKWVFAMQEEEEDMCHQ